MGCCWFTGGGGGADKCIVHGWSKKIKQISWCVKNEGGARKIGCGLVYSERAMLG